MTAFDRGIKKNETNQSNKNILTPHPTPTKSQAISGCSPIFSFFSIKMTPYTNVSCGGKALQREAHIPYFLWHVAKTGLPLFSANQALLSLLLGYNTGHIPAGCLTYIPVLLEESHFGWFVQSTPRIVIFQISHGSSGWKHSNDFNLNTFKTNQPVPWSGHLCCTYCLRVHFASHECQQISVSHCDCTVCLLICKTESNRNETVKGATTMWASLQITGQQMVPEVRAIKKTSARGHPKPRGSWATLQHRPSQHWSLPES